MKRNANTPKPLLAACLSAFLLAAASPFSTPAQTPTQEELRIPPQDAVRSPTGLVSKVLRPGTGSEHPARNSVVSVHFTGWTPDGEEFESSYASGKPAAFNLDQVFAGWREGIQLMVVGEKRRLWIPAHLAPPSPKQGPEGAVVFDVELLGIIDVPSPPESLAVPEANAVKHSKGAFSKVLQKGTGDAKPKGTDGVLLNYTGWTASDGKAFDSTVTRMRPTMIPLQKVMPAFAEVMQQMVVGEKRRIWIPGEVAQRNWTGAPEGDLVFEAELLAMTDASQWFQPPPAEEGTPEAPPGP